LGIEVVARRPEDLDRMIERHIRFSLMRGEVQPEDRDKTAANRRQGREGRSQARPKRTAQGPVSLRRFVWLARREAFRVETTALEVDVKTPKEVALSSDEAPKPVLAQVATNLRHAWYPRVFRMEAVIAQLEDRLLGKRPRSVLLVGPAGVGKTAAVHELVRHCKKKGHETPFWSTSGARLVAGMTGFGMWQEQCQALCREAAKTKAVVHLGNLFELMEVGQHVGNTQGVGDFLRPAIARGELLAIAECTAEQLTKIERETPNMLEAFARIEVKEPSVEEGRMILRLAARQLVHGERDPLDHEALAALDRLHRRYATYSAYPGRPLRFLHNLLHDSPQKTLRRADVTRAFSVETGLPLVLLEDDLQLDLAATRQWFAQRVIGQERAREVIVDLLATVKAGLARPQRPIASLLFIGPTGVGKTEMAKTLAEFLYRDRQRMTRIDMSEYADAAAVDRLISGGQGGEGLLTSKVRQQPFGVVLLDEFEKAHPRFFDMLLQVLGEGRLTDSAGRLADFRNAVIIMTSNLGSESFGRPTLGFDRPPVSARAEEHFVREVQKFVRPELFNRIDRIVPFLPLDEATLRDIARRELDLLRQREGMRYRDVRVEFDDSVPAAMVGLGYDPRYGARPIKRAIDRHLLAPLATALNSYAVQTPLMAEVRVKDDEVQVDVGRRVDKKVSPPPPGEGQGVRAGASVDASADEAVIAGSFTCADRPHPNPLPEGEGTTTQQIAATPRPSDALVELARSSSEFRRRAASVAQSGPVQEVRGDLYHLERQSRSGLSVRPPASSGCPTLASECSATWWLAAKP
jgi:ATP-dependent Clp protease ATP-binding subunit ClpA